uniref:FBA_2 domain-containing protein n=1 Tax=Steinernema glaseri TaxID=37863 RepID=A0A1I7YRD3_9BILA
MAEEDQARNDVYLVLERLTSEEKRLEKELERVRKDLGHVERLANHFENGKFIDPERTRAKMKAMLARYPTRPKEKSLSGAGMAMVPLAFRQSVCATLGTSSRNMLQHIEDGTPMGKFDGPWSKVAYDTKVRYFNRRVFFEGKDEVSYSEEDIPCNHWDNPEEIKKSKYSTCYKLDLITDNRGGAMGKKGDLPKLLRRTQIECLKMSYANYLESYVPYISPWYLTSVEISDCKFKSASPLSCWLKKVVGNKCLSKFMVSNNSVEEPVQMKYNLEDAVYNLLAKRDEFELIVHSQEESIFSMIRNNFIADLDVSILKRLLEYWTTSKEGSFRKRIRVIGSCDNEEVEEIKRHYKFGPDVLQHVSGQAEARISNHERNAFMLLLERTYREGSY